MAKIAVVIPVYKVPFEYLDQCVESIINQTYTDLEIIIVDDGSPEEWAVKCDSFRSLDERIKVFHKKNGGLSDARNFGLNKAESEWITFVDGDDWIDLDFLESFVNRINSESEVSDIYFYSGYRNYPGREEVKVPHFPDGTVFRSEEEREELQTRCFTTHVVKGGNIQGITISSGCMKVYNVNFLKINKLLFPIVPYDEDSLFYLDSIELASSIEYVSKAVYHYRFTEGSIVNKYRPNSIREQEIYLGYIFDFAKKENKSKSFIDKAYMRVMTSMLLMIKNYFFHAENPDSFFKRHRMCSICFRKEPYSIALKKLHLRDMRRNAQIKLILLRLHLYSFVEGGRKIISGKK